MGGRGSASGLLSGTAQQEQKMSNIKRALANNRFVTSPVVFSKNKDGSIGFSYTETQRYAREKGGKMISPEKADVIERTTVVTGSIYKDGLILKNKPQKTERLIKKGRLKR